MADRASNLSNGSAGGEGGWWWFLEAGTRILSTDFLTLAVYGFGLLVALPEPLLPSDWA